MHDSAPESKQEQDEQLALAAGLQVLMGNYEPQHENDIGIGLYAKSNLTSTHIQFLLNNTKEKKWEELIRFLNYMDFLLKEAEKWERLAAQWEIERAGLIVEQEHDFEILSKIGTALSEEPFDAEMAKKLLEKLGTVLPDDVTDDELRRLLVKGRDEIIQRTQQRQQKIDEWTLKIEEAKRKAQELRSQAEEYDRSMKRIYADEALSPEDQAVQANELRSSVHQDVNFIRGFNGSDEIEMKQERDRYSAKREQTIAETVPQVDQSQSFFSPG